MFKNSRKCVDGFMLETIKDYVIIFFISMVPIVELRGAIPIAQGMGLPIVPSYIVCIIGNMIPVPIVFFFARKFLEWGADKRFIGKICTFFLKKGAKAGRKLSGESAEEVDFAETAQADGQNQVDNGNQTENGNKAAGENLTEGTGTKNSKPKRKMSKGLFIALMLFVGVPLPGTGAWTGTLGASMLDMKFRDSVIAVMLGVLIAGIIMMLGSLGVFSGIEALFSKKEEVGAVLRAVQTLV